jgi:hypothetical protein
MKVDSFKTFNKGQVKIVFEWLQTESPDVLENRRRTAEHG